MSEYFGSAYCTLAATPATNPAEDDGILEPGPLVAAKTPVTIPSRKVRPCGIGFDQAPAGPFYKARG